MTHTPPSVVILGSVNMDVIAYSDRLPRPGETILGQRSSIALGGKGANQAAAVARLGLPSVLIGRIGADAFGTLARQRLSELGVDLQYLAEDSGAATGLGVIHVDRHAENAIVVASGANGAVSEADVDHARAALSAARVLLLQLEVPLTASLAAAGLTRSGGGLVILDPAPVPVGGLSDEVFNSVDVVTPNETETEALVGIRPETPARAADAAARLMARGARAVIVTMGARGTYFQDAQASGFVPPFPVTAVNSVGAGDAFNGGLAVALAKGAPLPEAVRFAAACGALATTGAGGADAAPTLGEVERLLGKGI
jgi:ribokinase